ncbi:hypothetical protein Scep_023771 [Stephania cephalantha]|uniref:CHCH domain-containing protein n=1 Tax=Stephania cephalantha TaxID=152367 RepID=A0AAP0EVA4_9MAGN
MAETRAQAVCAKEALELLNCATETPYDPQKCARLMNSLHDCVLKKKVKKFLLPEQSEPSQPESAQRTEEKSIS